VVLRTLDAGADKPLPFLTNTEEENPALGVRGLRTAQRSPQVLADQLEAVAQAVAAESAEAWVMAPMVATADEAREFVALAEQHGLGMAGVMIETPAAAITADHVLAHAKFASLGTNDLGQYTMAADRLLGELAALNDPWQPAVLRMVKAACDAGTAADRPVGVCGEAASDPALAVVLVGLGVSSLSMTPRSIAAVSEVLRRTTLDACRQAAAAAVAAPSAVAARHEVRQMLAETLDELAL
jgi:phosphotransferase system enzyme I (PtsI)